MKWVVMSFNILTIAVLGYILYLQITELDFYRSFDVAAAKSVVAKAAPAEATTDSAIATEAVADTGAQVDTPAAETEETTEAPVEE